MAEENTGATPAAYQPPAGSLEAASLAILERLSDPSDTEPAKEPQPEQPPTEKEQAAEQAPPAPVEAKADDESEAVASSEEASEASEQPATVTVTIDGKPTEVTLAEALKGYSRTQDYTRKTMELAEQRKALQREIAAEREAVQAEKAQYAEKLPQVIAALNALTVKPDWARRALEVPPMQLSEEMRVWDQANATVQQYQADLAKYQADQDEAAKKELAEFVADQHLKLQAALPDLADPDKRRTLNDQWFQYAQTMGFSQKEYESAIDHRILVILDKAMRYDRQQKDAPALKNKIEQKIQNASPGSDRAPSKLTKQQQDIQRARKSGRVEDAAAAIEHLL